jgi:hypothetical protein
MLSKTSPSYRIRHRYCGLDEGRPENLTSESHILIFNVPFRFHKRIQVVYCV